MAVSEFAVDTGTTISTTEYSLPNDANYASGSVKTDDGVFEALIDFAAMAAGDQFRITVYEKVYAAGSVMVVSKSDLFGPQSELYSIPPRIFLHGWDITVTKIAGTDRSINWSIRKA